MKIRLLFHAIATIQVIILIVVRCKLHTFAPPFNSTEGLLLDALRELSEGCIAGTFALWLLAYAEMKRRDKPTEPRPVA